MKKIALFFFLLVPVTSLAESGPDIMCVTSPRYGTAPISISCADRADVSKKPYSRFFVPLVAEDGSGDFTNLPRVIEETRALAELFLKNKE